MSTGQSISRHPEPPAGPPSSAEQLPETRTASADVVRLAARAFERDRYLAALLAPRAAAPALLAIAAFAGDVARIPATVSEPMLGAIRLQWWRDALTRLAASPAERTGNPIADAVGDAIHRHGLPAALFVGYVDAQEVGLGAAPPADLTELQHHLAKTEGAMFELAILVLGGATTLEGNRDIVPRMAMASGLTRLLLELPAFTAEGRTLIPKTSLTTAGIMADDLYSRSPDVERRIGPIVLEFVTAATDHLAALQRDPRVRRLPRASILPLATVIPTLVAVRNTQSHVLTRLAEISPLTPVMRLTWTWATGRL